MSKPRRGAHVGVGWRVNINRAVSHFLAVVVVLASLFAPGCPVAALAGGHGPPRPALAAAGGKHADGRLPRADSMRGEQSI